MLMYACMSVCRLVTAWLLRESKSGLLACLSRGCKPPLGPEAYPTRRASVRLIGPFRRTSLSLSLPANATDATWRFMAGVKWSSRNPRIQVTITVTLLMTLLIYNCK